MQGFSTRGQMYSTAKCTRIQYKDIHDSQVELQHLHGNPHVLGTSPRLIALPPPSNLLNPFNHLCDMQVGVTFSFGIFLTSPAQRTASLCDHSIEVLYSPLSGTAHIACAPLPFHAGGRHVQFQHQHHAPCLLDDTPWPLASPRAKCHHLRTSSALGPSGAGISG